MRKKKSKRKVSSSRKRKRTGVLQSGRWGGYKGVKYIATRLVKYFPSRYPTYSLALPRAREIFEDIQSSGDKVNLKSIFLRERKKRERKQLPYIPPEFFEPINYWSIQDYPSWIKDTSSQYIFRSLMIFPDKDMSIQGGSVIDYHDYFADFVNYCNDIRADEPEKYGDDSSAPHLYVRCEKPTALKGKDKGKYVVNIISCDISGVKQDYGYRNKKPTEPKPVPVPPSAPAPTPPTPPAAPVPPSAASETDRLIKLEQEKRQTIIAETEKIKEERQALQEKLAAIRELKDMGLSQEEIKKYLKI